MSVDHHPTLENDAIQEAVFELRFVREEDGVPEVFLGRMASNTEWASFRQSRLPFGDFPETLRRAEPQLRFQPIFELVSADGHTAVRVGSNVLIYSRRGAYQGWETGFSDQALKTAGHLFAVAPSVEVSRLGLRYINALRSDLHKVSAAQDLAVNIEISDRKILNNFNLNFKSNVGTDFESLTRLSTIDFASGAIPDNTSLIIDIDVHTSQGFSTKDFDDVAAWASGARSAKNTQFFNLLGPSLTESLRKK